MNIKTRKIKILTVLRLNFMQKIEIKVQRLNPNPNSEMCEQNKKSEKIENGYVNNKCN